MADYRLYTKVDAINGESTLSGHKKHNQKFADIQSWFPVTTSAAQYEALLLDAAKTGYTFTPVLRSDAAISITGVGSLAAGDMFYFDGSDIVRISVGSSGQTLKLSGTVPTWTTVAAVDAWSQKTTNFTTGAGGRYKCTSGVTSIALHTPADGEAEFYIKSEIGNDFSANNVAFTGAMNIAGAAATSYVLDQDAIYHFTSDGTDYDVAAYQIER
jgi:hypothetical protein